MISRRNFLKTSAIAVPAASVSSLVVFANGAHQREPLKKSFLPVGMAGYTFVNYTIDQAIAIMNRVGITHLSVKDFHLPLDSSPETIREVIG